MRATVDPAGRTAVWRAGPAGSAGLDMPRAIVFVMHRDELDDEHRERLREEAPDVYAEMFPEPEAKPIKSLGARRSPPPWYVSTIVGDPKDEGNAVEHVAVRTGQLNAIFREVTSYLATSQLSESTRATHVYGVNPVTGKLNS